MKQILLIFLLLGVILSTGLVLATDFSGNITQQDQQKFDQILEPVMKIYNFIKYAATALAVVFLVFAGITF